MPTLHSSTLRSVIPCLLAGCVLGSACTNPGTRPGVGTSDAMTLPASSDTAGMPEVAPRGAPWNAPLGTQDPEPAVSVPEGAVLLDVGSDAAADSEVSTTDSGVAASMDTGAATTDGPSALSVDGLVVHEWGTYTSVQASDGHSMGGIHHEDETLPVWVHRRNFNDPQNYYFEGLPEEPRQQLETPVLYFYSSAQRDVHVSVAFPQGVVGEWYPDTTSYSPAVGAMTAIAKGSAEWDLTIDPAIATASFNPISPNEIWAPSRRVASTPVRAKGPISEREQFLFYRGLGTFVAPVTVSSNSEGTLRVQNDSADEIGAVFLLLSTPGGGSFASLGKLGAHGQILTPVPGAVLSIDAFVQAAQAGLYAALVQSGLYSDESRAMVDTWTRSWFHNQGLRALYVAPRGWANTWLPTKVTPEPSAMVRTLVGRIEVMTTSDETTLVQRIQSTSLARGTIDLVPLGRFAESRLERAVELLTDPKAKALAETTRAQVHATR